MNTNAVDFWKSETAQQRLLAYWKEQSRVEGKIERSYFLTGRGKDLLRELSESNREKVIDILIEMQTPASHLDELKKITTTRGSWVSKKGTRFVGLYDEETRTIFLHPNRPEYFRSVLIHELGHFFDHRFLRDKVDLDRDKAGEALADLFQKFRDGTKKEKENIKEFLGV